MNSELRDRSIMVGLLLIAWSVLVYLKTKLDASVLPDLNAIIAQVQVLMGGVVGYHVGTGADPAAALRRTAPPVPAAQGGYSLPLLLIPIALGAALLAGCASLTDAGHTAYTFEPVTGADGKPTGAYKFSAADGKEFSSRNIAATCTSNGCQVMVQEGASTAFQGQAIAGKALSVLPSFAPLLLPQGPATLAIPQATPEPAPAATGPKL